MRLALTVAAYRLFGLESSPSGKPRGEAPIRRASKGCRKSNARSPRRRRRSQRKRHGAGKAHAADQPAIEEIFRRFAAADPEPKSELEYVNPFTLLVAVVLSAQATDAGVNKATPRAVQDRRHAGEDGARSARTGCASYIKTIGLYRNKARNVIELSRQLIAEHGGEVPRDRAALEALPGVGRKTANVVLNVAFGEPTMAVDTHVFRVANRTGLSRRARRRCEVEEDLLRVVPAQIRAARPPLADPARALRLQGAQARMPALHHPRPLPLRGKNTVG